MVIRSIGSALKCEEIVPGRKEGASLYLEIFHFDIGLEGTCSRNGGVLPKTTVWRSSFLISSVPFKTVRRLRKQLPNRLSFVSNGP